MLKCGDCMFFVRGMWAEIYGGGPQDTGTCDILLKILKADNSFLAFAEWLIVQDTFGCRVGKRADNLS